MQSTKTKRVFRYKIFIKHTKITFENNAFLTIKIILGNFKFVILGQIWRNFKNFWKSGYCTTVMSS